MDRAQKEKVVDELGQIFESSGVVVVAHYAGLTVAEMQNLPLQGRGNPKTAAVINMSFDYLSSSVTRTVPSR